MSTFDVYTKILHFSKKPKPKLHPSYRDYPPTHAGGSDLRRVALNVVEVVEVFGLDYIEASVVEAFEQRDYPFVSDIGSFDCVVLFARFTVISFFDFQFN